MHSALIGYTGYVGSTLLRQGCFEMGHLDLFRSTSIDEIKGRSYDVLVCAGAPAKKWLANSDPMTDRMNIDRLISRLETVKADRVVLISTVDVFKNPTGCDESTPVDEDGLHPYGLHRRMLERFVEDRFASHLIVRLPGLVGPGLRKNVLYDLLHNNDVEKIDGRGSFQYYPMVNLRWDIDTAWQESHKLVHLVSEPITTAEVAEQCFNRTLTPKTGGTPASYDVRSKLLSRYNKAEVLLAIRAYAQGEPLANAAVDL